MFDPLTQMEDDIHGVRQLLEVAMLLMGDLPGADAERVYRVVVAAHDKQLVTIEHWKAAWEASKETPKAA